MRVMCVAAHPDDEALGCGATLAKHVDAGDIVMVVVLSDGVGSRRSVLGTDIARQREFLAALAVLGVQQNAFCDFPDQRFDTVPLLTVTRHIEDAVLKFQPTTVYTHYWTDRNRDHRIVCEAVDVACRPLPHSPVKRLLHFEGGPGFEPNWFVDVSSTLLRKLEALECYASELRQFPHPRSLLGIEYLAKVRGQAVGVEAAEAFMLGRNTA